MSTDMAAQPTVADLREELETEFGPSAFSDEQLAAALREYLDLYDETYSGLTWDQSRLNYIAGPASNYSTQEWDSENITNRMWLDDDGETITVNGDVPLDDMRESWHHDVAARAIDDLTYDRANELLLACEGILSRLNR